MRPHDAPQQRGPQPGPLELERPDDCSRVDDAAEHGPEMRRKASAGLLSTLLELPVRIRVTAFCRASPKP